MILALVPWPAAAQTTAVRREILALFDGRHEAEPHLTRIHKFAEMPLNHLGFNVVYRDIDKSLPAPASMERYRAILTWFEEPLAKPEAYVRWVGEATQGGVRLVVLGQTGVPLHPSQVSQINALLGVIGLRHSGNYVSSPFAAELLVKDSRMLDFERPLDPVLPGFEVLTAEAADVTVHLTVTNTKGARGQASVLLATSPRGGFAAGELTISYERNKDRLRWLLNPFEFFKAAMGPERFPVPDVTTLSGRRIYFSHIDGDGWNNVSEIERYKKDSVTSAEVVLKELIEPYPDLPVTVGLIAGDVEPELGGDANARAVARRIFALPQVEVGSHTHTHPYNWQFFERYRRDEELRLIDRQQRVERKLYDRAIGTLLRLAGKEKPQQLHQRYIAGSDDLPRTYMRRPFELESEIEGALRTAEQLAPAGKRAMLYQWSGDTTPFEEAVRATREAGVRNINGGDSRLDMEFPSVAYVPPIGRPVGAERQIYAVNSNENTYTNDWTGPYYGFRQLAETASNTESPRRIKAFNVYYHMYSGEKPAALQSVKMHLETVRAGRFIPIPASQYAAIADGFYETEIVRTGPDRWTIARRGDLQTVRIDDAEDLAVDLERSIGVVGANRHRGSLYVALDADAEDVTLELKPRTSAEPRGRSSSPADAVGLDEATLSVAPGTAEPLARPYLVESRWRISELSRRGCGLAATAEGFGPGQMTWAGLAPGKLTLIARRGDRIVWQQELEAPDSGVASITVGAEAMVPLALEFVCEPAG